MFSDSKQRYPHYQKLAYGVFFAARKLRHYFQDHTITVVSKAPLKDIINNADATGRVAKWGIELAAFDIQYKPRTAIKSSSGRLCCRLDRGDGEHTFVGFSILDNAL